MHELFPSVFIQSLFFQVKTIFDCMYIISQGNLKFTSFLMFRCNFRCTVTSHVGEKVISKSESFLFNLKLVEWKKFVENRSLFGRLSPRQNDLYSSDWLKSKNKSSERFFFFFWKVKLNFDEKKDKQISTVRQKMQ